MEFYFEIPKKESLQKFLLWSLFFLNLAVIVFLWQNNSAYYISHPGDGNIYRAVGRLAGLLGEFFVLLQLILIGRVAWVERAFGFDRLNHLHRWVGYFILILLLSHPALLVIGAAEANQVSLISQLSYFLANQHDVLAAYVALVLFMFVILLSYTIVRKKLRYETWYFAHLLTYLAVGLAFQHQVNTGDLRQGLALYYWYLVNFAVFGSVLLYRFLRPLMKFARHRFFIEKVVQETHNSWSLYISGRKINKFRFKAGQYANITILAKGLWYTHPFSFSAAPNGNYLRFSIKNLGDYTSKIPRIRPGTRVIIDGPLGLFTERPTDRNTYLFIAGGIGITPIRSLIESLGRKNKGMVLLYANRSRRDILFKEELDALSSTYPLTVHHVLSQGDPEYGSGRIDKATIVRLVPDFFNRQVFLCGPPSMITALAARLKELGFTSNHLRYERFSF